MRRAAKIDGNHTQVVSALTAAGASVLSLAAIGKGAPDLCIGYRGVTLLMEVKNPATARGRKGANDAQKEFMGSWRGGAVALVDGAEAALRAIGAIK